MHFVATFIAFLAVKEFRRFIKFWPSYSQLNLVLFWGTVYIVCNTEIVAMMSDVYQQSQFQLNQCVQLAFVFLCQDYPLPNAHCLVLTRNCADDDERKFVKEYIKDNQIYIKLGILFMLLIVHINTYICVCKLQSVLIYWITVWRWCRYHHCTEFQNLLPGCVVAFTKGMQAVKHCSNVIFQFLTQVRLYNGSKTQIYLLQNYICICE